MPPKGSTYRTAANDSSAYDDSTLAKQKLAAQAMLTGRGRRNGATTAFANGSSSRDLVNAALASGQGQILTEGPVLEWPKMDRDILHAYRTAYRLPCPSSFKNPHATSLLASPIGKCSPTMARAKEKRRIAKEQLASQVRRMFNDMAVVENETVLDIIYKLRNKDKTFRVKFPAVKPKQ